MKKSFITASLLGMAFSAAYAGVIGGYGFQSSVGTYTELDTSVATQITWTTTDAEMSEEHFASKAILPNNEVADETTTNDGFAIGFDFGFGNGLYDKFIPSTDGYIALGKDNVTINPAQTYYSLTEWNGAVIGICPFRGSYAYDDTAIYYQTTGTEGSKVFTIEYKNLGIQTAWNISDGEEWPRVNLQIKLYQADGKIEFIYKGWAMTENNPSSASYIYAGINEDMDYMTRMTPSGTYDWQATEKGTSSSSRMNYSADSNITDGLTFTFTMASDCVAPTELPTALELSATTISVEGSFTAGTADNYLVLISKGAADTAPEKGKLYNDVETLGNARILSTNAETSFRIEQTIFDLPTDEEGNPTEELFITGDTEYTITIYAYNSDCKDGPVYAATPLTGTVTTAPAAPQSLTVESVSTSGFIANVVANENDNNMIVVMTNELQPSIYGWYPRFGTPKGELKVGDVLEFTAENANDVVPEGTKGGTVIYVGPTGNGIEVADLAPGTPVYLGAFSYTDEYVYSTEKVEVEFATVAEIPYSPDLEKANAYGLPAGWSSNEDTWGDPAMRVDDNYSGYGDGSYMVGVSGNATPGLYWLELSPILVNQQNAVFGFDYFYIYSASRFGAKEPINDWQDGEYLEIQATTDGETYTTIARYDKDNHPIVGMIGDPENPRAQMPETAAIVGDLTQFEGQQVTIRVELNVVTSGFSTNFYMQNIYAGQSNAPVIKLDSATFDSATISWSGEYESYEVEFGETTAETLEAKTVMENTLSFTDLKAETVYKVRVRGVYQEEVVPEEETPETPEEIVARSDDGQDPDQPGGGETPDEPTYVTKYTEWSGYFTFTTLAIPECPAPTDLKAEPVEGEEGAVELSWVPAEEDHLSYELRYRKSDATEWTDVQESLEEASYKLTGLETAVAYTWTVRATCTLDRISAWARQNEFTLASGIISLSTEKDFRVAARNGLVSIINSGKLIHSVEVFDLAGNILYRGRVNTTDNVLVNCAAKAAIVKVNVAGKTHIYKVMQ